MKQYPLHIQYCVEFEGYQIVSYYSKGHHNKQEFIDTVKGDYEFSGIVEHVKHCYGKLYPSPTGEMLMNYMRTQCKGSFPVTVIEI